MQSERTVDVRDTKLDPFKLEEIWARLERDDKSELDIKLLESRLA